MAIKRGSRYGRSTLWGVVLTNSRGEVATRKYIAPPYLEGIDIGEQFSTARLRAGVFLDAVAFLHSRDEQDWWIIAMASSIVDPLTTEDGDVLVVPGPDVMKDLIK